MNRGPFDGTEIKAYTAKNQALFIIEGWVILENSGDPKLKNNPPLTVCTKIDNIRIKLRNGRLKRDG